MSYELTSLVWPECITMVRAQPADFDVVLDILEEAARWITSRGINQWSPGMFRHGPRGKSIAASVQRGEVYFALFAGQVAGTVTVQLDEELDRKLWAEHSPDIALYVHLLAVRRAFAGRALGRYLIKWAEQITLAAGKSYLRLDCMAENSMLCSFYEQMGFVFRGEIHAPVKGKGWKGKLYEKRLYQ